jgi:3-oxoacyl-[acyl-carrier protein] reductase
MFADQVVIITGAGRGIGAAAAWIFARAGAAVVVNDLDADPAQQTVDGIRRAGGRALAVPGSVIDPAFPAQLMQTAVDTYGKINVLVNNAGFTWDGMAHTMEDAQWQTMLDVHLTAPFRMIRAAAPFLREVAKAEIAQHGAPQEPRCIVNVSSTSGLHGNIGQANYAAAKMGIVGLTKTVAKEWGALGIRCNAVAFGYIDTRLTQPKEQGEAVEVDGRRVDLGIPTMLLGESKLNRIPLGRAGTPEEAAGGIVLLASPLASYITGHILEVTGGAGI